MSPEEPAETPEGDEVRRLEIGDRHIVLVGTAHVSQESVDLVRRVVEEESPDVVCVELDEQRLKVLTEGERWKHLDLHDVIRRGQLPALLISVLLASYQRRMGLHLGVAPGSELLAAVDAAREAGIPVELCDREVRITLRRAWAATGILRKSVLIGSLMASVFDRSTVSEEDLRELRRQDMLSQMMAELGEMLPGVKQVLFDERDAYLAEKIRSASGRRVVAVIGAGHLEGVRRRLEEGEPVDLDALCHLPPPAVLTRVLGVLIPLLIVGGITWIGFQKGAGAAGENARYWILANGIPSSIGAALAFAHPFTILAAFLAAPVTSLTPVIGAGYVTALVQTYLRPPRVHELETVGDDVRVWRAWWHNRLLRIFLAFVLPGLGSMVGTWVGGYRIVKNLF